MPMTPRQALSAELDRIIADAQRAKRLIDLDRRLTEDCFAEFESLLSHQRAYGLAVLLIHLQTANSSIEYH